MSSSPSPPKPSEITPEAVYTRRRQFLGQAGLFVATSAGLGAGLTVLSGLGSADPPVSPPERPELPSPAPWKFQRNAHWSSREPLTSYEAITTYNNYYELGLTKSAPAELGYLLKPRPWTVSVEGEVKPRTLDVDTLIRWFGLEERVYRMRCIEAWSMVIPWLGFPLSVLIRRLEPSASAKFVEVTTLLDPAQLPNQESPILPWPYVEGLRMDEAMHPLAFLAVGLYGSPLPGQNGAPLRLVVPWKYGFKGAKSIVRLRFTREQPMTTWSAVAPDEYGFFANVNPDVDHPRWSQKSERRIGELERRPTLLFNGYATEVADLYRGMDLARNF